MFPLLKRGHFCESFILTFPKRSWSLDRLSEFSPLGLGVRKWSVQPFPSLVRNLEMDNSLKWPRFHKVSVLCNKRCSVEVRWKIDYVFTSRERSQIFSYKLLNFRHDAYYTRWSSHSWSLGCLWLPLWLSLFKIHRKTAEAFEGCSLRTKPNQNPEFPYALHSAAKSHIPPSGKIELPARSNCNLMATPFCARYEAGK